ncbi:hypothetical protein NP493_393g02015 [Ridgeia piscesae]|uniref:Uncharacterized protein n=1 Tax=Ridgeia piscesae TaxID=27915 RepID=A0AAD9L1B9_RIDPI|nr:hypothetical protein NP493_393g02015 [Ridgeia piscesae]
MFLLPGQKSHVVDMQSGRQRALNQPADGMTLSILSTIFCCIPIGVYAIVRSSQCRAANEKGDHETAEVKAKQARIARYISLAMGIITKAVIIFLIVYFAT